ncbi:AsmA family protein [Erwinia sp. P6884]|uniref:AsmA family protein n=1 Tax=Erwinia sp. P6884 TaxID=3141450 RepID=UPI003184F966
MKLLGKILLTLLLVLLLIVVTLYVLLQTQWGAGWVSRAVTQHTSYQLAFSKLEHNFSDPAQLILNDVSFGRKAAPALLAARHVTLTLSSAQFTKPHHFAAIQLEEGTLRVTDNGVPLPFAADRLQLIKMSVNRPQGELPLVAQQVNGGIVPWQPVAGDVIGTDASFQMSADSLELNGIPARNVFLQGRISKQQLVMSNVGADVALGSITASAQRDARGAWQVANLRLNSIRLQTSDSLSGFFSPLRRLPPVHFDRIDVTGARLEGADWAVTDLNLALKDLTLRNGEWESDEGSLSMNARSFVNGSLQLNDPILNMTFSPEGVSLTQFSSRWVNGLIRTSGKWNRSDKKLTLDELAIAGIEYTLPLNWRERWMKQLPEWLSAVEITRFEANRNLIIDINPVFPFQMTALDGSGKNLLLARQRQWGIWSGNLRFNAAEATFNRVDMRHPSVALTADDNMINVTEMSAFIQAGMVESLATVSQQPQRALSLTLQGHEVPVNLLQNWGWPEVPLSDKGELRLKITGSLAAETAMKPTVNGILSVSSDEKSLEQRLQAGQLVPAP